MEALDADDDSDRDGEAGECFLVHGGDCSEKDEEEGETCGESCSDSCQELTEFGVHGSEEDEEDDAQSCERCSDVSEGFGVSGVSLLCCCCVDVVERRTLLSMPLVYTLCLLTVNTFHQKGVELGSGV